jgi:hypothetical protein
MAHFGMKPAHDIRSVQAAKSHRRGPHSGGFGHRPGNAHRRRCWPERYQQESDRERKIQSHVRRSGSCAQINCCMTTWFLRAFRRPSWVASLMGRPDRWQHTSAWNSYSEGSSRGGRSPLHVRASNVQLMKYDFRYKFGTVSQAIANQGSVSGGRFIAKNPFKINSGGRQRRAGLIVGEEAST